MTFAYQRTITAYISLGLFRAVRGVFLHRSASAPTRLAEEHRPLFYEVRQTKALVTDIMVHNISHIRRRASLHLKSAGDDHRKSLLALICNIDIGTVYTGDNG